MVSGGDLPRREKEMAGAINSIYVFFFSTEFLCSCFDVATLALFHFIFTSMLWHSSVFITWSERVFCSSMVWFDNLALFSVCY